MSYTIDNQFSEPPSGEANWDSDWDNNMGILERGYHTTAQAGVAVGTGNVLCMNSGGFLFPFNTTTPGLFPQYFSFTAANSGDSMQVLARGIVRSLGITSNAITGQPLYVSALTPGIIVTSYAGEVRRVGWGLLGGVLFDPYALPGPSALAQLSDVNTNGVTDGQVLTWANASSKWVPASPGALNLTIVTTFTAAAVINSGYVVWIDPAANTAKHFDPNSEAYEPAAFALTGAAGVGSLFQAVLAGYVSGYKITSAAPLGKHAFISALTPGLIVGSYGGANRPVGRVVNSLGLNFDPSARQALPERLTSSFAIAAVTGSLHVFSASGGRWGWNRQTVIIGNSANLVELKWYADSGHTTLLYATVSGGVTSVGSFQDRAGWPYENTDASTLGDLVYGTLKVMSAAAVGSDTISVQMSWDRHR